LARIPDVAASLRPATRLSNLDAQRTDLRIDPPVPRGSAAGHRRTDRVRMSEGSPSRKRMETAPDESWRRRPAHSSILPAGNPFQISQERLQDKFAPVVRFLMLFVLFTAAGTSILMIGRAPRSPEDGRARAGVATLNPAVAVPTAMEQGAVSLRAIDSLEPELPVTTASANAETVPAMARSEARISPYVEPSESPATEDELDLSDEPGDEAGPLPYPTTKFTPARLPTKDDGPLPQVRTTDAPAAVARQAGAVRKIPIR
jgi:hypothetical protein